MTKPVTIPNTFATATTAIPLSNLDADFSTVATALNDANTYSNYAPDTGSANAYVVTLSGVSTTYSAGLRIQFKAGNANTTASTLNVNGGGAKNITYQDATAIASGTIAANSIVDVMYDGTQFLLMNDPAGATGGDVVGPSSATDNAIVRFDGTTGKLVQNSVVTIADSTGDISGVGQLNATTLDATNIEVTNIKAKDGTAAASIADSTGVISITSNPVLSGGTANGVLYLNGSKVATSGSALTFDGAQLGVNGITVGRGAGAVSTNTAVGASALAANTTGKELVAVGTSAAASNTTGSDSVYVGRYAGYTNTTGTDNAALGDAALWQNTTGGQNTAIGRFALAANTTASNNTAVGYQAGYSTTTGYEGVHLGARAGYSQTDARGNVFIGRDTGYSTTGGFNTFVGFISGNAVTTGTKNTIIGAYSGNQGGLDIRTSDNYIVLSDGDGNPRGIFDNSGNFLAGTTGTLNTTNSGNYLGVGNDSYHGVGHYNSASGASFTAYYYNSGYIGGITQNGTTAVAYNTTSDYRLKDNPQPLTGSGAFIDALKPKTWNWKADGSRGVGFIAHEVQEVSPGSVVGTKDAVDEEGKPIMQAMEYGSAEFIANIIAELQSLRARVAQLESKGA